jgi:hypothetical protein
MPSDGHSFVDVSQEADQRAVRPRSNPGSPESALSGTGFTYRHDWGRRRGSQTLRLNWGAANPRSRVFVSIGEGAGGGLDNGKFIGSARYTVHNVAPRAGGVDVWVNIEWGSDISLYVDYLVINPPGLRTVRVTVHRHSTVALTDAEADRILRDMGTVLQTSDSQSDIATPVQFVRNGPVRVLPQTVAATIQTQAQWNALMSAGTGVKVVRGIQWCSGPGGSIIGCAPVGSGTVNLAVVRFAANQEGILWAHEYGHNVGLGHRTDESRALMFPSIGSDHNVVNGAESARFLAGPLAITGAKLSEAAACGGEAMHPPDDVLDFVSQHWIEGVPHQEASQYTEEDARRLLGWLVDEPDEHEDFLPEIVTTLCYIGSELAVDPLIEFLESPRAGEAVLRAKSAALIHLGDLAKETGSQTAVEFLTRVATDMETAKDLAEPQVQAMAASATVESLGAELAVSATLGLSLAGTRESEETISRLKDDPEVFAAVNQAAAEAAESL